MKSDNKDRWRSHVGNCDSAPDETKRLLKLKRPASVVLVKAKSSTLEIDDCTEITSVSSRSVNRNVTQWVDRVNQIEIAELDEYFANIFYQTGVPFRLADHHSVRKFVSRLRPAYACPSAKQIAGKLLDNAHKKFSESMNSVLEEAKYIHIVSDGWSSLRRDHYVNFIAVFNNEEMKPMLVHTINTGEEAQNGENIAKDICSFMQKFGDNKVASLVTDNAKNMKKAWDIVRKTYPKLIINGCAAHTINLLVKDICHLPQYAGTLEDARAITAFVKDRNALTKRFERIQASLCENGDMQTKLTLVYVGETRWYTHHACVERVLINKNVLKQLIDTNVFASITGTSKVKQKKERFRSLVNDCNFWKRLEEIEVILKPTSTIVGILERDTCCLSDIYRIFLGLLEGYSFNSSILDLIKDRWAFLHSESMGFAYFLDPTTSAGKGFIGDDMYDNHILLKEFAIRNNFAKDEKQFQAEYERYISDMHNLSNKAIEFIANMKSPLTYWLTIGATKFPILSKVAEIVFKVPTSQAAAERAWSIYDFILTKRRNRLSPAKVTKLVQLYMNSEIVDKENNLVNIMMGLECDVNDTDEEIQ